MVLFWLLAGAMVLAALLVLIPPLLKARASRGDEAAREAVMEAHRARLAALERQRGDGSLGEDAYADAREELERQVLADADATPARAATARPAVAGAIVVAAVIPLLSLLVYMALGRSDVIALLDDPARLRAETSSEPPSREQMLRLADNLTLRLDSRGDDLDGWRLLARTRLALGQYAQAAAALERAVALAPDDPETLIDSVEAMSMANDMRFPPSALERIERALARVPAHPKALMLGALAALQRGERERALERLGQLLDAEPAASERARFLEGLIARIRGEPAPPVQAAADGARIVVRVELAPSLAGAVSGGERVFVFARRPQGPPMPLAAVTLPASALPAEVVLDDGTAMVAGNTLSSASQVVVGARVSATGSATPASGDLEGFSELIDPRSVTTTTVVIASRRP